MDVKITPKINSIDVIQIIENAREAEMRQDVDSLQRNLQIVWKDFEKTPDYHYLDLEKKAELLRLSGAFLTFYASSKNLKDWHIRAKDLLTSAKMLFERLPFPDKIAETNILLGYVFGNCGETEEYQLIYELLEEEFKGKTDHPLYFRIIINKLAVLIFTKEFKAAEIHIKENETDFEKCREKNQKAFLHNNSGIVFRENGKFDLAAGHLKKAYEFSKDLGMQSLEARICNNLALLYIDLREYLEAHKWLGRAIKLVTEIEDDGLLANFLDSRALIYLAEKQFPEALRAIEKAIELFYEGENAIGLVEALWTKCVCLIKLERRAEVHLIYAELQKTASEKIGKTIVDKYQKLFDDHFYPLRGLPVDDELNALEEYLTRKALIEARGAIGKAAELLGHDKYQTLQNRLDANFPNLRAELGFKVRKSPAGKSKKKKIEEITQINLPKENLQFDFNLNVLRFDVFVFAEKYMRQFDLAGPALVVVVDIFDYKIKKKILFEYEDKIRLGEINFDNEYGAGYFIACDEIANFLFVDEVSIIGEPVAYYIADSGRKTVKFSKLNY